MTRVLRRALVGAVLILGLGAAGAQADTITVSTGSDPTEEVPLAISANWSTTTANARASVTVKPAGQLACGATYSADDPNSDDVLYRSASPADATANRTFQDPGTFTLCGYLEKSDGTLLAASGPVSVSVRSARASATITVPQRVDIDKPFPLSVAVNAELARRVYVTVKPAGGRGCEASYALDDVNSNDLIYGETAQGNQVVSATPTASQTPGTYLLCGYVQESNNDTAPEATTSATFLVGPDPCVTAKNVLASATGAVHVAERSVNANRTSYNRYHRAIRKAHGRRRQTLRHLAARAHSRYVSAVRRRAKARASLATAQASVATACGSSAR